ncbi:hypothetical protein StoSoilA2_42080 [Arthrobacter sp. StoSoilA2]|nr:hypothetical protein StoSoilA2_42080 [Arthrobacter sp. StoSoilA2]
MLYQLGALNGFAAFQGTKVTHIAPHGRLGNLVAVRADYAQAVAEAAASVDNELIVVAQEGELARAARNAGLDVAIVGIVDRGYQEDGTLVPRSQTGAVLHEPAEIVERTLRMVVEGKIRCANGVDMDIDVDTVLLHGDNPGAVELARLIRSELVSAGVRVTPLAEVMDAKRKAA